jgi:hypothetical protein
MTDRKLNIIGLLRLGAVIVLVVVLGVFIKKTTDRFKTGKVVTESSTVVLEKIEKVLKLVTIEGNYSEIMEYKDYQIADVWGLRKKAIIRVTGKVLVGFDLKNLDVEIDEDKKVIRFISLPKPEVLAVDANLTYYDLQSGVFNSFKESDLTDLNRKAKDLIRNTAIKDRLLDEADATLEENLDIILLAARAQGWEVLFPADINLEKQ